MDDLVKRLRKRAHEPIACTPFNILMDAAERIEELEAKLANAVEGFREIRQHCYNSGRNIPSIDERIIERCEDTASSAIAELTGGKDV